MMKKNASLFVVLALMVVVSVSQEKANAMPLADVRPSDLPAAAKVAAIKDAVNLQAATSGKQLGEEVVFPQNCRCCLWGRQSNGWIYCAQICCD